MAMFKKEDKKVLTSIHSNRGEGIKKEINLEESTNQWNEVKKIYDEETSSILVEQRILQREQESFLEKKKVFEEMQFQKLLREEDEHNRVLAIEEKIKNKKKREIKRRDIAFRNKSVLG